MKATLTSSVLSELQEQLAQVKKSVGMTPLFEITNFDLKKEIKIFAKIEWLQIGESVKARAAFQIMHDAIKSGDLHQNNILLDASSGNTGIAYAAIASELGLKASICLPENASDFKIKKLKQLGADIIFTSKFEGTDGAQVKALSMYEHQPAKYFYPDQYNNNSNWKAHYKNTAEEIWEQTSGSVTHFITGLGTTGTFTGTTRKLKEKNNKIIAVALQPDTPMHGLEGWKHLETAKVPGIYDPYLADDNATVSSEQAVEVVNEAQEREGLKLSLSSAGNLAGALNLAKKLDQGVIVTIFPDEGSKSLIV